MLSSSSLGPPKNSSELDLRETINSHKNAMALTKKHQISEDADNGE